MEMVEEIFLELLGVVHNIIFCLESEYKERLEQERNSFINSSVVIYKTFKSDVALI